ncbi:MAG TPA: hypothetical protein VGW14_03435 [Thermoleophilaceae bacterium]|nr:hypothetical protein [Thermoleophilaceae bacterium]
MRRRDPRRLIERERRARARVQIVPVAQPHSAAEEGIGSKQVAEVTLPRSELERVWSPEYLERLARTYWHFLTRVSLGLLRVLYTSDSREVVLVRRPLVLLRFRAPEYAFHGEGGTVTWPVDRGLLVASRGRGRGYLRLTVERRPSSEDGGGGATAVVTSEVVNFYPMIASRLGRWIYDQTQLRIHVIVTHAFLRSLANLDFQESRVGAFSPSALPGSPAASPDRGER